MKFDSSGTILYVKGELGAKVYIKGKGGWSYNRIITEDKWNAVHIGGYEYSKYFKVYLKDASGNKSKTVKIKNPNSSDIPVAMV